MSTNVSSSPKNVSLWKMEALKHFILEESRRRLSKSKGWLHKGYLIIFCEFCKVDLCLMILGLISKDYLVFKKALQQYYS